MKLITRADVSRIVEIVEAFNVTKVINQGNLSSASEIKEWINDNFTGRHKISLTVLDNNSFAMEIE